MTVLSRHPHVWDYRNTEGYSHASYRTQRGDPEPSMRELLDDPTLHALMASDGVSRRDLEDLIGRARSRLGVDEAASYAFLEARLLLECG